MNQFTPITVARMQNAVSNKAAVVLNYKMDNEYCVKSYDSNGMHCRDADMVSTSYSEAMCHALLWVDTGGTVHHYVV